MNIRVILVLLFFSNQIYTQTKTYQPPGKLIDMGGYKMHLIIEGANHNGPNIIFFHGAGDIALHWNLVLPSVGKFVTAVAIDQNGEGWSEHGHGASLKQQVYDSYIALKSAKIKPPYILVGHSLGGIIANLFAAKYKGDVAGVILVDATHPDVILKIYDKNLKKGVWKKMRLTANSSIPDIIKLELSEPKTISSFQPKKDFGDALNKFSKHDKILFNWIYNKRPWTYVKSQSNTYEAEIFQEMYENKSKFNLGSTPLTVITGMNKEIPEGDEKWNSEDLINHSFNLQKDLLRLSTNSKHVFANKSGHNIHIDQPELIVKELKNMIDKLVFQYD